MHSEAHMGWVRPLWYIDPDDRIIALLFSAQVTLSLFHSDSALMVEKGKHLPYMCLVNHLMPLICR